MKINLPYPVSANRYWRRFGNVISVSAEAKHYKRTVGKLAVTHGVKKNDCLVQASIVYHPKLNKDGSESKRTLDLDNVLKVTLDALNGVAYADDSQVKKITIWQGEATEGGGLTVEITPL